MDKNQFNELLNCLRGIDSKLNTLITLARLTAPKQEASDEEKKILQLCNMKNTVDDISKQTQKSKHNVEVILSKLRKKGIIKSVKMDGKVVYARA